LRARLEAMGNENFTPDHWGTAFTWDQMYDSVRTEAGYEFINYLPDNNRKAASLKHSINAAVYAEHWLNGGNRLEFGVQFRHDFPRGDSYFVVLRWDFSAGRGYQDYGPREMKFRELRTRRIPPAFNNTFEAP
jgi:hypothetical protein